MTSQFTTELAYITGEMFIHELLNQEKLKLKHKLKKLKANI